MTPIRCSPDRMVSVYREEQGMNHEGSTTQRSREARRRILNFFVTLWFDSFRFSRGRAERLHRMNRLDDAANMSLLSDLRRVAMGQ